MASRHVCILARSATTHNSTHCGRRQSSCCATARDSNSISSILPRSPRWQVGTFSSNCTTVSSRVSPKRSSDDSTRPTRSSSSNPSGATRTIFPSRASFPRIETAFSRCPTDAGRGNSGLGCAFVGDQITDNRRPITLHPRSDVESEEKNVPILHDVLLSFRSHHSFLLRALPSAVRDEVVEAHRLRANEATLEVRVNHAGCGGRRIAAVDRPCAHFRLAGREVRLQSHQVIARTNQPVEPRGLEP